MKKNVMIVDYRKTEKSEFFEKINEFEPFDIKGIQTNKKFHHTKLGTIIRYLIYFLYPLYFVLFKRSKYNRVLAWQQFYGINIAFWSRLFKLHKINYLAIDTFIYKKRSGKLGNIYYRYVKWSIDNKYVDKIICYSSSEPAMYANMFGMSKDKFCFVPLGIEKENTKIKKGDFVFSTGRSNRDYDFLIDALSGSDIPVKIACSGYEYRGNSDVSHVEILHNCYESTMLHEMSNSLCVVIPLKDTHISSGQLVILQAMQLGKPVIVTENDTAKDYLDNGITGYIIKKDKDELLNIIRELKDNLGLYNSMSEKEMSIFEIKYSLSGLAENIWKQIK